MVACASQFREVAVPHTHNDLLSHHSVTHDYGLFVRPRVSHVVNTNVTVR